MKKIITILCVLGALSSTAQDVHFTMWDAVPITTNPATTGVFTGDHRGVLNYRNQWSSVGNPYITYSLMVDAAMFKKKWQNGFMGIGLNVYKDKAGQTNFGTTKIALGISDIIYLDKKNSAAVGLMGAWAQNSLSPNNLEWDAQFNGQFFDPSLDSKETMSFQAVDYFDISGGVLWAYGTGAKTLSSQDEFKMKAGLAFYHITRPSREVSFGNLDRLYTKWSFHADAHIGLSNTRIALRPKFLTYFQGPARQFALGTMVRYLIQEESKYTGVFSEMAISFGGYFRFGDAFSPSVEYEIAGLAIGMAYDVNVSGFSAATRSKGGPELYVKFVSPNPFTYGRGTKSNARFK